MVTLAWHYPNVAVTSLQRFGIIFKLSVGDGVKNEREKTFRNVHEKFFFPSSNVNVCKNSLLIMQEVSESHLVVRK